MIELEVLVVGIEITDDRQITRRHGNRGVRPNIPGAIEGRDDGTGAGRIGTHREFQVFVGGIEITDDG
jgi:hypothetical protein